MGIGTVAGQVGKAAVAARLFVRSFTGIDTNPVPGDWTHVTKVDPEAAKQLPILYPLYLRHTSAISVGGSNDVTSANSEATFELLECVDTPVVHEPSAARHVTERTRELSTFLAIPEVLNGDATALVGTLGEGTAYLRDELVPDLLDDALPWLPAWLDGRLADFLTSWLLESAVFEGYIIQNADSAAAREADVGEADLLTAEEAGQRALAAEKHLGSPVIYLEYSGTYGGEEAVALLSAIDEAVSWSRIWYGGGITSRADATAVLDAGADTVVVGNAFHEIAAEEVALVDRARSALRDASLSAIEDWVGSAVDLEATAAHRFLSTIPRLADPDRVAADTLSQSISVHLAVADAVDDPSSGSLASAIRRDWAGDPRGDGIPDELLDRLDRFASRARDGADPPPIATHVAGLDVDGE